MTIAICCAQKTSCMFLDGVVGFSARAPLDGE
jgi:hypothetical protein